MKNAIVTLAIGTKNLQMLKLAEPFFKSYARKCNCKYVPITSSIINGYSPHFEKFQIYNLLSEYDRILFLDDDIIVHENSPNVFDIVPIDAIGAIYDNPKNNVTDNNRKNEIQKVQKGLGKLNWKQGYINSGVIILSSVHKNVFANPELRYKFDSGFKDQTLINYNIIKNNYKLHILDCKFNGMEINGFSSRDINYKTREVGNNKIEAYFMHFANEGDKLLQMYKTVKLLNNNVIDIELKMDNEHSIIEFQDIICESEISSEKKTNNEEEIEKSIKSAEIKIINRENTYCEVITDISTINNFENANKIDLFYDISELGWAQYLAAHMKYICRNTNRKIGVICDRSRDVLYRDCSNIILPIPKSYTDLFSEYPSDGNHLFDPNTNRRLKDHELFSRIFKRSYPKFNIVTEYSKFEKERIFEPYKHSIKAENFCKSKFKNDRVIIVFPRYRESKFKSRNISNKTWISIINNLCKSFPKTIIVSIGSCLGSYDIDVDFSNYINLVNYNDEETLDILVCLCNTKQAIAAIGNQSGTIKITLLCKTPTYIIGDEEHRHTVLENWSGTECGFYKAKLTNDGYFIANLQLLINSIYEFVNNKYVNSSEKFIITRSLKNEKNENKIIFNGLQSNKPTFTISIGAN